MLNTEHEIDFPHTNIKQLSIARTQSLILLDDGTLYGCSSSHKEMVGKMEDESQPNKFQKIILDDKLIVINLIILKSK
jgi:hypothetical protein